MLEVAAHDGTDPYATGQPGHARTQAADAAHDEIDFHTGARGVVEGVDHGRVDQVVGLDDDAALFPRLCLGPDEVDDRLPQEGGRHQQLAVADVTGVAGEEVEELGEVVANVAVGGQQPEIGVEARRAGVVVAGPDVAVAADALVLLADHQRGLAVGLEPHNPVHDVNARFFQRARPADVGLLVEAGFHLDQHGHLLPGLGRLDERPDHGAIARGAVQRLLDGEDAGIGGGLLDEGLHRGGEGVVGVVDQDVALGQHGE